MPPGDHLPDRCELLAAEAADHAHRLPPSNFPALPLKPPPLTRYLN
jgi:hypothetical protein